MNGPEVRDKKEEKTRKFEFEDEVLISESTFPLTFTAFPF